MCLNLRTHISLETNEPHFPISQAHLLNRTHITHIDIFLCTKCYKNIPFSSSQIFSNKIVVQYKLYYFDFPGSGEQIRMLFHFVGQQFEDIRINKDKDWATMKTKFFYKTVPVLEVDGKQLAQSDTIMNYLGKKFGIAGKDEWEEAKASEIADFLKDIKFEIRPYMAIKMGFVKGDADKQRKETFLQAMDKHMPILEKLLADSGSGFMLPSGISYVDIQIAYTLAVISEKDPEAMGKYPKLVEYTDRVYGQPELKKYLVKRKM